VENYSSPEMGAAINSALSAGRFDIVHLDSIHLCSHIPLIRNLASQAAVVLDWHNIESELMSRYAANTRSALRGTYARYTAGRLQKLEGEMLGDCSGHIVCSEREKSLLIAKKSSTRVVVVENGVDTEHFQPSGARGQHLLFVGQMSYHANADAAVSFVRSIWPEIRRTHPDITLQIVGSDPVPSVKELHGQDGVVVTGTVPDVLPYYQGAFASVVPLHTGGGTRLKILEAMSAGTPVISTAVGAEGLRVRDGNEFLLADASPSSWTTALAKLSDETVRAALVQRARDLVRREYDWRIVGARLAECYAAWSGSSSRKSSIQ
jgi:glycosyltransferase involved in cell wall biosynthesis